MVPGVEGSNPFTHPTFLTIMKKETLIEKIKSESSKGKISCRQAFKLAAEADVSPKELGNLLNEIGIKVAACQLGCFP